MNLLRILYHLIGWYQTNKPKQPPNDLFHNWPFSTSFLKINYQTASQFVEECDIANQRDSETNETLSYNQQTNKASTCLILKKQKTFSAFLSSYRNTNINQSARIFSLSYCLFCITFESVCVGVTRSDIVSLKDELYLVVFLSGSTYTSCQGNTLWHVHNIWGHSVGLNRESDTFFCFIETGYGQIKDNINGSKCPFHFKCRLHEIYLLSKAYCGIFQQVLQVLVFAPGKLQTRWCRKQQ